MTNFEKECVAFVSGYMEAGVSAEDYVKAFAERLLDVARDELNSRQGVKVESVTETPKYILRDSSLQEEKQLLIKDLCARLPYSVVVRCTDSDTDYNCFLTADILHEIQNGYEYYDYKPYLRPMSSMTDEEKEDFGVCIHIQPKRYRGYTVNCSHYYTVSEIDWLNEHHFDYRGLIEKGLALEAPDLKDCIEND